MQRDVIVFVHIIDFDCWFNSKMFSWLMKFYENNEEPLSFVNYNAISNGSLQTNGVEVALILVLHTNQDEALMMTKPLYLWIHTKDLQHPLCLKTDTIIYMVWCLTSNSCIGDAIMMMLQRCFNVRVLGVSSFKF